MKNFTQPVYYLMLAWILSCCTTTRFYIVRHAEKACGDCASCGLVVPAGRDRALALRDSLLSKGIDTIFTSECLRTQMTARPLADQIHKTISIYQTARLASFITTLKGLNGNKSILVVGHSDQIPVIIDSLVHRHIIIGNDDFDNLFIITRHHFLKTTIELKSTTYGPPSP